ncbi:V-type proton ATPase 116 kDa subunit a 1-like isoform X2 [Sycon ciliatum]|uniref:V-type proton ATPase 116 kDa subunit a 1-like isoform X2 n=1 Tax=Sycon ciliatum TaxID=27933 RepID=UPI0031F6A782
MGSLFRSEEMCLAQLYLQTDSTYYCIGELGELGLVQFRDLNTNVNAFLRKYVNEVRRCDDLERILRFMDKELARANITAPDSESVADAPPPSEMIELEAQFSKIERELGEINSNQERLSRNLLELTELSHILRQTAQFFAEAETAMLQSTDPMRSDDEAALLEDVRSASSQLSFVAGVINRDRIPTFERLLWRACRGNVFLRHQEIDGELKDPATGDAMQKCVFIIFFQGNQLRSRVKKICDGFRATQYPCPETAADRHEMMQGVSTRIEDLTTVIAQTLEHRYRVLQGISLNINVWTVKVQKMKAIYHTMNLLSVDVTHRCLIGECWCPTDDLDDIQYALRRGQERSGSSVTPVLSVMATSLNPPTYNKVNKFTGGFQNIIDAYGIATYREVNPTTFTVITFPFLFAVMFGDCGHGLLMFLFALFMVLKENDFSKSKSRGEIFGSFFSGRYIILLMGLFSIYTGLVYNDCFSKSFNIFGSSWSVQETDLYTSTDTVQLKLGKDGNFRDHEPYPFGLDPIWQVASNKLTFTNSYKMKMSVILGVIQMMFGIVLSLFNHLYFRRYINIFGSFIPEVLFLGCIFGYLVFMIFFKWLFVTTETLAGDGGAPSLLIMLINMFLSFGRVNPEEQFYSGQAAVQSTLVVIAVLAVPWMLLTKPAFAKIMARLSATRQATYTMIGSDVDDDDAAASGLGVQDNSGTDAGDHTESIGDIFIHQAIHTIEFCLGCISNTASYLRLWALSLAHAELSEVLWTMGMRIAMKQTGGVGLIAVFAIFAMWAAETIAILLVMEGLSAFLHALRLHWVEFNGKFYKGEGYKFLPFSFARVLEGGDDE